MIDHDDDDNDEDDDDEDYLKTFLFLLDCTWKAKSRSAALQTSKRSQW